MGYKSAAPKLLWMVDDYWGVGGINLFSILEKDNVEQIESATLIGQPH